MSNLEIKGASSRNNNGNKIEEVTIPTGPRERTRDRSKEKTTSSRREHDRRSSHHESSRGSRYRDKNKEASKSSNPVVPIVRDPHELEREARNRERLLKEAQRIAGLSGGLSSRKRISDDGKNDDGKWKGRSKKLRGGAISGEDEEVRLARMEAEREGARWA